MRGLHDYQDRVGIVTGASSGIGAELARQLAARGMTVALVARRTERLAALADTIGRAGGTAVPIAADVAVRADVEAMVAAVAERCGRIDLLVNNAGFGDHGLFKDQDVADIERMIRTNYLGVVYAIKAALPHMRRRREGRIVNLSSVAGKLGQPDEAAYSASKFAVTGLSEALSYEFEPLGIHVMAVYPGLVRTEMFTPAIMARMPHGAEGSFLEPSVFCARVLRALERGRYEVTVPGHIRLGYVMRTLWPSLFRRSIRKVRFPVLKDLTS